MQMYDTLVGVQIPETLEECNKLWCDGCGLTKIVCGDASKVCVESCQWRRLLQSLVVKHDGVKE